MLAAPPGVVRVAVMLVTGLGGVVVPFIGRDDLIVNKRATGRPQDVADVLRLTGDAQIDDNRF